MTFGNIKEYKFFEVFLLIRMDFGDYVDNCLKQKVIYLGYNQVELKYTINEGWDKWEDITIWLLQYT